MFCCLIYAYVNIMYSFYYILLPYIFLLSAVLSIIEIFWISFYFNILHFHFHFISFLHYIFILVKRSNLGLFNVYIDLFFYYFFTIFVFY